MLTRIIFWSPRQRKIRILNHVGFGFGVHYFEKVLIFSKGFKFYVHMYVNFFSFIKFLYIFDILITFLLVYD